VQNTARVLLQISRRIQQWKNFKNRPTFAKVMNECTLAQFFWLTVYYQLSQHIECFIISCSHVQYIQHSQRTSPTWHMTREHQSTHWDGTVLSTVSQRPATPWCHLPSRHSPAHLYTTTIISHHHPHDGYISTQLCWMASHQFPSNNPTVTLETSRHCVSHKP